MPVVQHEIPAIVTAISGGVGGVVANVTLFPLDLITTRLQVQKKLREKPSDEYEGVLDAFHKIYRDGGVQEFYKGVDGDSVATLLQSFLYFFAYDYIRNKRIANLAATQGRAPRTLQVGEELLIGSVAGIFCKFFTAPINNVVIRQQTASLVNGKQGHELSFKDSIKEIYDTKGITGFWSGFKPTVILSINPSLAHYFFQVLSAVTVPRKRHMSPKTHEVFLIAAAAKTLATLLTYPIILAKTRSQVDTLESNIPFYESVLRTFKRDGFIGLYDGASSKVLKGFFSQGILMLTKDKILQLIIYIYKLLYRRGQGRL